MKQLKSSLLLALVMLAMGACKKDKNKDGGTGFLRVLHGVPDAGAVEVRVNGTLLGTIGAYGQSFPYTAFNAGDVRLQLRRAGTGTDFVDVKLQVIKDGYASFVVSDSVSKVRSAYVGEDPTPVTGKAKVNMYHLGTILPAVSFTLPNGTVVSGSRTFNDHVINATVVRYTLLEPGSVMMESRVPGTTGFNGIFGTSTQTLTAGKSYTYLFCNPVPPSIAPSISFIAN
jgi:hypothetical protein